MRALDRDREPFEAPLFERRVRLLRAAWAEFDETAARVSAELRPGGRGEAMRGWYAQGKPLGNWTIPYLLRHTADDASVE